MNRHLLVLCVVIVALLGLTAQAQAHHLDAQQNTRLTNLENRVAALESFRGSATTRLNAIETWRTEAVASLTDLDRRLDALEADEPPPPDPTPTPTPQPTAGFTVNAQGEILDPQGAKFVPVGINGNGQNWVWGDAMAGYSDVMDKWHFNTIRLNSLIRCWSGQPCHTTNNNLDAIIAEYTGKKNVVMLTNHTYGSTTGNYLDSNAEADDLIGWWRGLAQRHKDNPYVWFNIANEPTSHTGAAGLDNWQAMSTRIADAITTEAPKAMLVFDGHSAGQDKGTWSCQQTFAASAAIQRGEALQAKYGRNRVIMSAHAYNQWAGGTSGTNPRNCPGPSGDVFANWRNDMNAYLNQLQAKGVPLVWGEFGARNLAPEEDWFIGSNDASYLLTEQVLPNQDVKNGALFWHGSTGDARSLNNAWGPNWADGDLTTLSRNGKALYDYAVSVNP